MENKKAIITNEEKINIIVKLILKGFLTENQIKSIIKRGVS